ncbi:hypothetical protein SLS62_007900 [Diatrype stigma]|uniref:UBC core domain-containing protein n=1 Tax=Diatrype stigma TaxID=117547 RepID=A0AAN9UNH5_9PEZI
MSFEKGYPVRSPTVRMDSTKVSHPNIFGGYICADILRDGDGYTSAYTLKGIAIQLLSFFSSDKVDQDGGSAISLKKYRKADGIDTFNCDKCGFTAAVDNNQGHAYGNANGDGSPKESRRARKRRNAALSKGPITDCAIRKLPNEVLLLVLEQFEDFQDLAHFAQVWPRVSRLIADFDIVRQRELQCFCTKQSYRETKLGVGVFVAKNSQLASEFDLLSEAAYVTLGIRQSVHGIHFNYWLPLPLSQRHWTQAKDDAKGALDLMKADIRSKSASPSHVEVLYRFMNDIVVRLNQAAEEWGYEGEKSTLRHASEKAIESYFHLFHFLVCLATEDPSVVHDANQLLQKFANGQRSKKDCPNLGHLLIALLISDVVVTDELRRAIITEAITRNVVWMLDRRGANLPELSYMESNAVSFYRLDKTFQASRTSYRLLMFSELFRRTARPSSPLGNAQNHGGEAEDQNKQLEQQKPLTIVREELFERHGAPPRGAAARLAAEVRRLHTINDFPSFLREMGIRDMPNAKSFTTLLRQTVNDSMGSDKGYSRWAYTQAEALFMRLEREPTVSCTAGMRLNAQLAGRTLWWGESFFPDRVSKGIGRGGRGRGEFVGRGRGRGGYDGGNVHSVRGRGRGRGRGVA